jgi:actin-related protein 6
MVFSWWGWCIQESLKVGFGGHSAPSHIIPNTAFRPKNERRLYVGDQMDDFVDFSSLLYRRPFDKGYLVNPDLQSEIWERIFGKHNLDLKTRDCSLLLTEPALNFPNIQKEMDEIIFEKFQFVSYCRASGTFRCLCCQHFRPDSVV